MSDYFKEGAVILPPKFVREKSLMSMTIAQLKAIARNKGIDLPEKATKAYIVKALSESDK
jgi:hypothetical protein